MQQLRFAFRQITRRPRSSALAIGTIALALGASIGIGTIVDHTVLRPLPYPEPSQLVVVWNTYPHWRNREVLNQFWDRIDLAFPEYEALRARADVFDEIAIYRSEESVLAARSTGHEMAVRVGQRGSRCDVRGALPLTDLVM